jgi:hypothetical protein
MPETFVDLVNETKSVSSSALRIAHRRSEASLMSLRGLSIGQIVEELSEKYPLWNICYATIMRDLQVLKTEINARANRTMEQCVAIEHAKLDEVEKLAQRLIDEGDYEAGAMTLLKASKERRALGGYDKVPKIDLTIKSHDYLTQDELQGLISRALELHPELGGTGTVLEGKYESVIDWGQAGSGENKSD